MEKNVVGELRLIAARKLKAVGTRKNLRDHYQNMMWCACKVRARGREQSHWKDPIIIIIIIMFIVSIDNVQKEMHEAQISKLHDEMARLRELLVECRGKERETQSIVSDLRMSLNDLQNVVRPAK